MSTGIDWLESVNLLIAVITNVSCIYLVPVQVWWLFRTWHLSDNILRRQFLVAAIIKTAIWYWTFTQILMITIWDMNLPIETLPPRFLFMIGVLTHVFMTIPYYYHIQPSRDGDTS